MKRIRLSPSALNIFLECPRCFWLEKKMGIKRPRGIFPSLPGGMDTVIKSYFDKYRLRGELPPEIIGKVEGKLISDMALLKRWRNWKTTNLRYRDDSLNAVLSGALDDCLVHGGIYIPLDYKTRGSPLTSDPRKYYQNQLDCYCLMLDSSGYRTKGLSYLVYYWPEEVSEGGMVRFAVNAIKIETDIASAVRIFENAVNLLSTGIPDASPDCEYCTLVDRRREQTKLRRRSGVGGRWKVF